MIGAAVAVTLIVGVFGFLMRRPILFMTHRKIEIEGRIVGAEHFYEARGEAPPISNYRCAVEYVVDGKTFERKVSREARPPLGESVWLIYPKGHPQHAVEGRQSDVARLLAKQFLVVIVLLLALVVSRWSAK